MSHKPQWQDFTLEFLFTKWTLGSCFALAFILFLFKLAMLFLHKLETIMPSTIFYKYFPGAGQ